MRNQPFDLGQNENRMEWVRPNYLNGWADYGLPWCPGGWAVDEFGWVVLRGLITNPNNVTVSPSPIFNLPQDCRPAANELYSAYGNVVVRGDEVLRVDAYPDGNVSYIIYIAGVVPYLSLSGIRFKPDKRVGVS